MLDATRITIADARWRHMLRTAATHSVQGAFFAGVAAVICLLMTTRLSAQSPDLHSLYPNPNYAPGGTVGQLQRIRPEVAACDGFQPVKIVGPSWLLVAWADAGDFVNLHQAPLTLGLKLAPVYRFKVMGLPGNESAEIYPSIEVIDRLHPPAGQEAKFPIPIEITAEDLRLALGGQFVTRVIYVEDPDQALPFVSEPDKTPWFDAGKKANALEEADRLGRPVAILRIGGRQPDPVRGPDPQFLGGCPPLLIYGFNAGRVTYGNQPAVDPASASISPLPPIDGVRTTSATGMQPLPQKRLPPLAGRAEVSRRD